MTIRRPLLVALIGLFLAAPVGAVAAVLAPTGLFPFQILMLALVPLGVAATALTLGHRRGSGLDFLSPYVLMPLMFFVIYGLSASRLDELFSADLRDRTANYLCLGILAYLLGCLSVSAVTTLPSAFSSRRTAAARRLRKPINTKLLIAGYCIGVLGMLGYWAKSGGIPILSADLETSRVDALSGSGVPFYLSMVVMPVVWLHFASSRERLSRRSLILAAVTTALLLSTGWRNAAVAFVVVAVMIRHYVAPISSTRLLLGGVALVVAISGVGLYRVYSSNITNYETYQLIASGDYLGALVSYVTTYPSSFVLNTGLVIDGIPSVLPLQHGASIIWNYQLLLPGNDAVPFDFVLKDVLRQGFTGGGLPPTIIGEMYLNFGGVGVGAGMALLGVFYSLMHQRLRSVVSSNAPSPDSIVILATALYYLSVSVRGGLSNVLLTLTWLTLVTLAISRGASIAASRRPLEAKSKAKLSAA